MLLGAQDAGINVLASRESWKPALAAQPIMGINTVTFEAAVPRADVVIGNPPCARFSTMSSNRYTSDNKSLIGSFDELGDLLDTVKLSGANALWWETGPLLWTQGRDLVQSAAAALENFWHGPSTTYVVKVDARYVGVQQRRPRNHIITVRGQRSWAPLVPAAHEPLNVGDYLEVVSDFDDPRPIAYSNKATPKTKKATLAWVKEVQEHSSFNAMKPVLIDPRDAYIPAVVSSRPFVWKDGRWWGALEYAAMMGLTGTRVERMIDVVGEKQAQVLCSKGVSAVVSRWVAEHVVIPVMTDSRANFSDACGVGPSEEWGSNTHAYNLVPPFGKRQPWRTA